MFLWMTPDEKTCRDEGIYVLRDEHMRQDDSPLENNRLTFLSHLLTWPGEVIHIASPPASPPARRAVTAVREAGNLERHS